MASKYIKDTHPYLIEELDMTKNIGTDTDSITYGSNTKLWWKCDMGHEWRAAVSMRTSGTGCPHCQSIKHTSRPEQMFFHAFNDMFGNAANRHKYDVGDTWIEIDIYLKSLNLGMEYDGVRYHKDSMQKDLRKNALAAERGLHLIRIREKGLDKINDGDIIYNSKNQNDFLRVVIDILEYIIRTNKYDPSLANAYDKLQEFNGESYYSKYFNCVQKTSYSDISLVDKHPDLIKEWNYAKNGSILPKHFTPGSGHKVWWVCDKGHEWKAAIYERTRSVGGTKCPICHGISIHKDVSLATLNPRLSKEWHHTKNYPLTPHDIRHKSSKNVWWIGECKHEWQTTVANRSRGKGCPFCARVYVHKDTCLATKSPHLLVYWHPTKNADITPHDIADKSNKRAWWRCKCGSEWESTPKYMHKRKLCPMKLCPIC